MLAPLLAVVLLFVLSGAAGLVYEVIWIRALTLLFGKTVHAASAVLAAFMAGLALGSAVGGRLVDRRIARGDDPLRIYALLEAGVGVAALILPLLLMVVTRLYLSLSGPFEHLPAWISVVRFVLATLALMPATCLMGATLPALSRWAVRRESQVGNRLGLLYALNTLGGVAGCLLAGFLLLEALGLRGTTFTAVAGNFLVAGLAWWMSRRRSGAPASAPAASAPPAAVAAPPLTPRLALVMVAVGLGGFGALVLEVTWTRALLLVFGSTTYSFSCMLAVFLFGIGAGSLLMTPFADRLKRPWIAMGLLQGGIGILVLASAHAIDRMPAVYLDLMAWRGLTWSNDLQTKFLLSAALMLLPTLLSGAVWPVAVRLARPRQSTLGAEVGRLYAANTVGSILGSLIGAFVFLPMLGMENSMAAISILFAAFGAALVLAEPAPLARRAVFCLGLVVVAGALAVTLSPWDRRLLTSGAYFMPKAYIDESGKPVLEERLKETRLVYYAEGTTTTPSVAILGDINMAFFNDGKIEGATAIDGMRLQRMLGHLPFLFMKGAAKKSMNIGLGTGITAGAMGVHAVSRIDCAEIEPMVIPAARQFARENFSIMDRPGLRMIYNDGRNHLMLTGEQYDVMSSTPFAPLVDGAASLYSLEHFQLERAHLAPGGMLSQFLPLYQLSTTDFLSILKTFAQVFPDTTVWYTGTETVLLGGTGDGTEPPVFDFETLARRMEEPKVAESLRGIGLDDPMRLLATYCFRAADVKAELDRAPLNTDDRPQIEFSAPRSHLVNTVKDNLPWLMEHRLSPQPYIRFPQSWAPDDPRRKQLSDRLAIMMKAQGETMQGRLQVLRGDLEGGIATLEQAVQTDTADIYARDLAARNLVKLAERYYAQKRDDEAVRAYQRAMRWDPNHFLSLYNLARFAWERGDTARARQLTEAALAQAPYSPSLNYRMGLLQYSAGDMAGAERSLNAALDHDPTYPEPLLVLGDIARAAGDHAKASFLYRKAIDLGRKDPEAWSSLAQSLADEGRRDEAARYVELALARSPDYPEAIFTRARLSLAAGQREAAAQDLRAAVQKGGDRLRQRAMADPDLRALLN